MTPFILPQIFDLSATPLKLTPGTYTELVNDTWNGQDVDTDPTLLEGDAALATLEQNGGELPGALDAVNALNDQGNSIPTQDPSTFTSDMATATAQMQAKYQATSDAMDAMPNLLELPLNPAGQAFAGGPVEQINVDIGNLSISGPPYTQFIGNAELANGSVAVGVQNIYIYSQQGANAQIIEQDFENNQGIQIRAAYTVEIQATALGAGTVQVNYNNANQLSLTIVTYTFVGVP